MTAKEKLIDNGYEGITYLVNFSYDDALIGVTSDYRCVYDYDKMVENLVRDEEMTIEEAMEWIDYNTIRALPYMGSSAPLVMYRLY